jgi:hypothetical protein
MGFFSLFATIGKKIAKPFIWIGRKIGKAIGIGRKAEATGRVGRETIKESGTKAKNLAMPKMPPTKMSEYDKVVQLQTKLPIKPLKDIIEDTGHYWGKGKVNPEGLKSLPLGEINKRGMGVGLSKAQRIAREASAIKRVGMNQQRLADILP